MNLKKMFAELILGVVAVIGMTSLVPVAITSLVGAKSTCATTACNLTVDGGSAIGYLIVGIIGIVIFASILLSAVGGLGGSKRY